MAAEAGSDCRGPLRAGPPAVHRRGRDISHGEVPRMGKTSPREPDKKKRKNSATTGTTRGLLRQDEIRRGTGDLPTPALRRPGSDPP